MASTESLIAAAGGSLHDHRKQNRKMRWWYESLADFMIATPNATQNEIAAHFGRATSTISTIVNTDAFKAYMRQRRAAHAETLDASVRSKMLNVVDKSMDLILDRFEKKRDSIPLETIQKTAESALRSLGYGTAGPSTVINNNVGGATIVPVAVSLDDLERARAALRNSQRDAALAPPLIDVTPIDVTPETSE